ncbi:MAG: hypothetical protein H6R01_1513 [Burkholderiaceae bacterium]|nr:hypothetical protein [Burkholderiaceae bacterium]
MIRARIQPDRASLEIMHRKLQFPVPLDDMLRHPVMRITIEAVARRHMRSRAKFDHKKIQANDSSRDPPSGA